MASNNIKRPFIGALPFLSFLALYISVGLYFAAQSDSEAFFYFPAPASALLAFGIAMLLAGKKVDQVIHDFISGIADNTVILMCLVFLLAGAFSSVSKSMGGVESTVNLGLTFLPNNLILPSIFLIACFVSLAMGTSMGTSGAVMPIAFGLAEKAGFDPSLAAGIVLGGAIFGDNLSIISDTTIAATGTQNCSMRSKMIANLPIAIPAALVVTGLLFFQNVSTSLNEILPYSLWKTLPYLIVIVLSVWGLNVLAVLMIGITLSGAIGLASGQLTFVTFGKSIYTGFLDMSDVFFLTLLIAGLAALATKAGTIHSAVNHLHKRVRSKRSAEGAIATIVSLADIALANNTIAILVTGKVCKNISNDYKLLPQRIASILDIFSCAFQGLLPYAPQMLLAASLTHLSPFQILPYTWYPMVLGTFSILSILFQIPRKQCTNSD